MTWAVIDRLPCGCELIEQTQPAYDTFGTQCVRSLARCTVHLCRVCGAVPLADSEPDRLCEGCYESREAAAP